MHDLSSSQAEITPETFEFGPGEFNYESNPEYTGEVTGEYAGEYQGEYAGEMTGESPLGEAEELELASELLEVSNEEELDRFLGDLIRKAARAVGSVVKSPLGRALGGILKGVAKRALPVVGGALGSMIAPGVGTAIGSSLASSAGRMFGLELEGLSAEDQEFELARQYVRFAGAATQNATLSPQNAPPQAIAQQAVNTAAQKYAPGLVGAIAQKAPGDGALTRQAFAPTGVPGRHLPRTGRWVRQGRNILLMGAYR